MEKVVFKAQIKINDIMKKITILPIFILAFVIFSQSSLAFTCTIRSNSCSSGETCLFSILNTENSHAGDCNQYSNKICCNDVISSEVRNTCNSDEGGVISLFANYNSHAENYGNGMFHNHVCAKFAGAPLSCSLQSSCNANETCVVSMNKTTNSHVANCNYYGYKLCCGKLADLYVNQSSISQNISSINEGDSVQFNITVWNIGERAAPNVNVSCYRNGTYFDSYIINSIPPDPAMAEPRSAYCDWVAQGGVNNISVRVDPANAIAEYNESNNEAWKIVTVNFYPVVTQPTYNVTPAEILRGQGIHITCDVTDAEDTADQLAVNISIKDPNNVWSNASAGHIGNTFYRDYSTSASSALGTYVVACTAVDTNDARKENTSTFLVWQNATITINLNATEYAWEAGVNVSGQVSYVDTGYVSSSDVAVKISGRTKCTATTNSQGVYSCVFNAPGSLGNFTLVVEVTDVRTGKTFLNSTILRVTTAYGEAVTEITGAENVVCYEVPQIIQNPDGTIKRVTVKVCVWK